MVRSTVLILALLCLTSPACTRITVKKDPGPHDRGFRYYRPKPYLMIVPGEAKEPAKATLKTQTTVEQLKPIEILNPVPPTTASARRQNGKIKLAQAHELPPSESDKPFDANTLANEQNGKELDPGTPGGGTGDPAEIADEIAVKVAEKLAQTEQAGTVKASISLMYMPDFAEEYSVQLRPGLGIGELNFKLENGWNLTSVGMKTDQQTDEIINSVANLVGSLGKGTAAGIDGKSPGRIDVLATNIPFGMYEAVIAEDPCGRKQLYGWRYVGFMPFQSCPTCTYGGQQVSCNDPNAIYGLVMDNTGTMRFEKIAEIPYQPQKVSTIASQSN